MKRPIYLVIAGGLLLGLTYKPIGSFKPIVPFIIGILLFFSFLNIKLQLKSLIRKELMITLLLASTISPILAYYVFSFSLGPELKIGLVLVASAPSGIIMLILSEYVEKKDSQLIVSNFFLTHFAVIIYLPILLKALIASTIEFSQFNLLLQAMLLVVVPFSLAATTQRVLKTASLEKLIKAKKIIVPALVFMVISISIAKARSQFDWQLDLLMILPAVLAVYLAQGTLAWLAGRLLKKGVAVSNTLALVSSSRNIQFMLAIALLNFSAKTVIVLIVGIVAHHITNILWLTLLGKKEN